MGVCATFKQQFRGNLIQDFKSSFNVLSGDTWFVGIGKLTEWVSATGSNADATPPRSDDTVKSETDFWRQAYAFKRVIADDVCLVIPKYDWERGQIYDNYRDDADLFNDDSPAQFFVLVDDERVYKCIDNNYGASSTIAPTHTDYQIRLLSDGYRWKYLYSIPDSKRKFVTTSSSGILGYIPVEHLTSINANDERILQWDVQQAAVTGSIDFIELDETMRDITISDRVVFPSSDNQVAQAATAGSSSVVIAGPNIVLSNDYYLNYVFRVESGMGAGQQRVITSYVAGSNTATLTLDNPLDVGVTGGTGSTLSLFSIYPHIKVIGDGESNDNTLNTAATTAEITPKFLTTTVDGITGARYIDSIEIMNAGKNYTYADIVVVSGLTSAPGTTANLELLATAVMSPPGGHGSNPVNELGASSLMIVTDFTQDEDGKVTSKNDYRQFCLIKNPLLREKQVRLSLYLPGVTASFIAGHTATQGATALNGVTGLDRATGDIVSWQSGPVGTTGTAELILTNVDGNFVANGIIDGTTGFAITNVREITVAGNDQRSLKKLTLIPYDTAFSALGTDFTNRHIAIGVGNSGNSTYASYSNGSIYSWEPEAATNLVGNLFLEYPNGNFVVGEYVSQMSPVLTNIQTPIGEISEINEELVASQTVYDQTTVMGLVYDGIATFDNDSFVLDATANCLSGGNVVGVGYVMDWITTTGNDTGSIRIMGITGSFNAGNYILYNNSGETGALISEITSRPELAYRSGEIMYLQNLRPIARSLEQTEEIKLVVEF